MQFKIYNSKKYFADFHVARPETRNSNLATRINRYDKVFPEEFGLRDKFVPRKISGSFGA